MSVSANYAFLAVPPLSFKPLIFEKQFHLSRSILMAIYKVRISHISNRRIQSVVSKVYSCRVRCWRLWVSVWIEVANDRVEGARENQLNGSEDNLQIGWDPRQENRYYQRYQDRDESAYDNIEQYSGKANPLPDFQCLKLFFGRYLVGAH